jgi:hypothetical protein
MILILFVSLDITAQFTGSSGDLLFVALDLVGDRFGSYDAEYYQVGCDYFSRFINFAQYSGFICFYALYIVSLNSDLRFLGHCLPEPRKVDGLREENHSCRQRQVGGLSAQVSL